MSISFWKISDAGALSLNPESAGTYVSKQMGLEARKIRATRALASFADPQTAVAKYNEELGKLELAAGAQFTKLYDKAVALGHPEDVCKDFALRHASASGTVRHKRKRLERAKDASKECTKDKNHNYHQVIFYPVQYMRHVSQC
jgi:hypothetical protein